jgi:DNA helicase-2/ATP-dependent DNA helicase PcrA
LINTIIFDVDGTLLDSEKIYMRAWVVIGQQHGYDVPQQALLETRAVSAPVAEHVFKKYCGADFPYAELMAARKDLVEEMFDTTPPEVLLMPGAAETLQVLKDRGYALVAASSTPYERTCKHLRHAGLYRFFDAIVCGDMVPHGKPAPDIYLHAAASLGLAPENCLAIEDSPAGIQSAYAAGCHPVLVPDLDGSTEELRKLLHAEADTLPELLQLI